MSYVHEDIDEVLVSQEEIQDKISALAKQITEDYRGKDLLLVGVLRGPQRDPVGVQRGRERGRVVRAPRPLDGQGAELAGSSGI